MSTIGLIAGGGRFPLLFAESARKAGHRVVAVAHKAETDPALSEVVDAITWVKLGQLGHLLLALKAGGATKSVMLGSITKRRFFTDALPDSTGLKVLARIAIRSDDNLLRAVARFLEEEGVPITDPTPFLADRLAPLGVLGRQAPTDEELLDARYGLSWPGDRPARRGPDGGGEGPGGLGGGGARGDRRLHPAGRELARSGGFVVVKAVKPNQDRRFDLPAVGPETVDSLIAAGGRVLAVEAGATL